MIAAIQMIATIYQPVHIENNNGINTELSTSFAYFLVSIDGVLPRTLVRSW